MFKIVLIAAVFCAGFVAADDDVQFALITPCDGNSGLNPLGFGTIAWTSGACMYYGEDFYLMADCATSTLKIFNSSSCTHMMNSEPFACNGGGFSITCGTAPENTVGTMLLYNEDDCSDKPNTRYFVTDSCIQQDDDDDDEPRAARASPTSMTVACEDKKIVVSVYTSSASCTGTATSFTVPSNECLDLNTVFPSDDDDDDYDDDDDHPFLADKIVAKCGADTTADGTGSATTASVTAGLVATVALIAALL
ncbi:uncharacterized protein MONBRDRAFT_37926 [Monosiga brevicollis MX1]|uniref:Uncharacterized protein n=1 Tax=Monosiga brevicollis TaxID=81824 RepID=A9V4N0_MONBE|nr:uncharacterized protein MONBRDRAFT_37926 [Monosiga brevicollis MX1]EDQ87482.1 predicted protein [Monosiga brevicollis MX1]|eukprot:XP_001747742.1 hypothetical protein [Monosiga brevicollis MX1]